MIASSQNYSVAVQHAGRLLNMLCFLRVGDVLSIYHNIRSADSVCNSNIEMTPLCKVDVTLAGVRRASGVRGVGGVDEQEGIRPRGYA